MRPIDAGELKKAIKNSFKHNLHGYDALLISEIDEFIDNAPTVTEIPQGEKIKKEHYGWVYCSECGSLLGQQDNFCWHCGAKMRKGGAE